MPAPRKPERGTLADYRHKRDSSRTAEPRGGSQGGRGRRRPVFVVQLHDATTEHYDFRLEADGVLRSWAVPKGPSLNPRDKRLAVATEDHPLDYAGFEGVIAAGQYGAGRVIVWDKGYYVNRSHDRDGEPLPAAAAIEHGHIAFDLHGRKLRGRWSLTRMRRSGQNQWLLVKSDDEFADRRTVVERSQPESVKSGRRIEELTAGTAPAAGKGARS
jgi:DNA ligase D-like protein (predicted 3'-phosphoesterase)